MSLRFHEEQLRDQGRNTVGVWGIRPEKGDHIVAIAIVDPDAMLLVAGENGIGKRTPFDDYRRQSRGGKGIITMRTGEKTGDVVGALTVREADEIMLITNKGQMVRTRVKEIRETGRNTMGVKLMDLRKIVIATRQSCRAGFSTGNVLIRFAWMLRGCSSGESELAFPYQHQIANINKRVWKVSQYADWVAPENKIQ